VIWKDRRYRALLFQALALIGVIAFSVFLVHNALENLARRGIATGFDFLGSTAGFGIIMHLVDYTEASSYGRAFVVGLLNTLLVSAVGIVFSTLIGFSVGLARLSSNWLVARLAVAYVEIVRNVPLLLQLFFWYFATLIPLPTPRQSLGWGEAIFLNNRGLYVPAPIVEPGFAAVPWALIAALGGVVVLLRWNRRRFDATGRTLPVRSISAALLVGCPLAAFGIAGAPVTWQFPELRGFNFTGGCVVIPEFIALLLALSAYTAAFIAEIVRAGIQSVGPGQIDAAYSLGLKPAQTLRRIVIPQALRVIVPPLTSQYLNLTKNSSLAVAIAYPDLVSVFMGTVLNQTGQAVEVIAITMGVYLVISLGISLLMNRYNRRVALVER